MPPITQILIIANTAVFLLQLATGQQLVMSFALWPLAGDGSFGPDVGGGFQLWQLVTYSFLHGGIAHLFFNMFALYMFGSELERLFGPRFYLAFYFACVITAGIAQLLVAAMTSAPPYPTVGASGGVFGLLLAFGMYFPRRTIMLIFPPIPLPAWLFVTLYGLLTLYMGITGVQPGVAHFAHLGGMLGGYLMIQHRRGRFPFGGPRRRW
ncbi:rhomboid family intramembrane serine protease [Pelomicrobium sp.]|jgi:membrane associated rhomboid family serine protease|uniref:rhomboid family intramembrane serine protease n=1 Tax=Pelomicrobium sp. TaxID=2815319 RepID=UPI002FDC92C6